MSDSDKEVENQILEAGEKLIDPPSSVDELVSLLDKLFVCLSKVEQSPPNSMQNALSPLMKALVAGKLFKHSDADVKVAVAACISEITRITDPDAPEQMRDKQRAAEISTPERTDAPKDESGMSGVSNSVVQGNDSSVDTESTKKQDDTNGKDEPQQVDNPSNTNLDNTSEGKPDVEHKIKEKESSSVKQADTTKSGGYTDLDNTAGALLDSKDVLSSPPDDSSINAAISSEKENKVGVQALPSKTSAVETVNVSSSSRAEDLFEEIRQKKKESSTKEAKPSATSATEEGFEEPNTSDPKGTKKSGKKVASSSKTKSTVAPSMKSTSKTAKQSEKKTVESDNVQESANKTGELATVAASMDKDWKLATQKQREEVLAAKALADDLDLCFKLQMQEAITVSSLGSTAGDFYGEADETNYTDLLLNDLTRLDLESTDRLLAQQMMNDGKLDLDLNLRDRNLAHQMQKDKSPKQKCRQRERKPYTIGESSTSSHTFLLYSKGLVCEGLIKDDERQFGGFGVSICDSYDKPLLEMKNPLGDELLAHPEAAELAAIIHGLKWALDLDLGSVIFFCDNTNILEYVTGKAESNEPTVATLVKELALLQSRFSSCQASHVRKDITSVIKLAKDAIASQTRWTEDGIELETCPICYEAVKPHEKFEVPRCYHRICLTCMNKHVTARLSSWKQPNCPYMDCETEVKIEDCKGVADPNQIEVMIQRKKEEEIKVEDRVYCPKPICSFLMSKHLLLMHTKSTFLDAASSGARKCMMCGFCFCIDCETEWHYAMTCEEFRKTKTYRTSDRATFEAAADRFCWKTCRVCQTKVELAEGCKHMTCSRCKHEFCYTCGAEWVKKKATCKCPFRV